MHTGNHGYVRSTKRMIRLTPPASAVNCSVTGNKDSKWTTPSCTAMNIDIVELDRGLHADPPTATQFPSLHTLERTHGFTERRIRRRSFARIAGRGIEGGFVAQEAARIRRGGRGSGLVGMKRSPTSACRAVFREGRVVVNAGARADRRDRH